MRRCLCRWFLLVSPEGAMVFIRFSSLCLKGAFTGYGYGYGFKLGLYRSPTSLPLV